MPRKSVPAYRNREQPSLTLLLASLSEAPLLSGQVAWVGMNLVAEGLVRRAWDAVRLVVPGPPEGWGTRDAAWHGPPRTCSRRSRCPGGRRAAGSWGWAGRRTAPLMTSPWLPTK